MSEKKSLNLQTTVRAASDKKSSPFCEVTFASETISTPKDDEVIVQIEASPINPSDLYTLFHWGNLDTIKITKNSKSGLPVGTVEISEEMFEQTKHIGKVDKPTPCGSEGAGVVVKAGKGEEAQKLRGKHVAIMGAPSYAQYRVVPAKSVMVLPSDLSSKEGAAAFVNPLTALSFVEVMKEEKFKGIINTAAASQLGQMLNKICLKDNIPLINIVRKDKQVQLLKKLGAKYVLNSTDDSFNQDLENAIEETGIYLAFDATGGGELVHHILTAMERVASKTNTPTRYGTDVVKQIYIYGYLDSKPLTLPRLNSYGMRWNIGQFLVFTFLDRAGSEKVEEMKKRVVKELKTTFSTHFDQEIGLLDILDKSTFENFTKMKTGSKYYVNPTKESVKEIAKES